jgi:hypothetical protein
MATIDRRFNSMKRQLGNDFEQPRSLQTQVQRAGCQLGGAL